jgi:hypothetical protein
MDELINMLLNYQHTNSLMNVDDLVLLRNLTNKLQDFYDSSADMLNIDKLNTFDNNEKIENYLDFILDHCDKNSINLDAVEDYWASQVEIFFRNQPFTLTADPARTIGASLDELFDQAKKRQKENPGTQYLGSILQHLVAAKLSLILPSDKFVIHGASVADAPTDRGGDFVINNTIIHCTTAPGEPLIQKCKVNINAGCFPVIITVFDRVKTALDLAADAELNGRVDVWDIQQFLATNINEHSQFDNTARNAKLADIIEKYNSIIDEKETDPSLKIDFEAE